jgi:predicted PurR-regulated permease PerM
MKPSTSLKTTTSDRLTKVLSYGALLLLGYFVYLIFAPFLVPLVWSAVLAIFFYPLHERVGRKLGPTPAALVSTLAVTLLLIVPAVLLAVYTARQAIEATASLQSTVLDSSNLLPSHAFEWIRAKLPANWQSLDFSQPLRQGAERVASFLAGNLTALVKNLFRFFVNLFILVFALFFMFRDGDSVERAVRHLLPFDDSIQDDMMRESKDLIFASVAIGLLVAGIHGAMGMIAFAIGGIKAPLFWGALIAFFSLVPVIGSALIWLPASLWLGFTGHWGKAIVIIAIMTGAANLDNILRPMLLRNRTRLNELLLFIGVLGGLEAFGLLGLVIGPTIVAAAMGVFRVYMDRRDEIAAHEARVGG